MPDDQHRSGDNDGDFVHRAGHRQQAERQQDGYPLRQRGPDLLYGGRWHAAIRSRGGRVRYNIPDRAQQIQYLKVRFFISLSCRNKVLTVRNGITRSHKRIIDEM